MCKDLLEIMQHNLRAHRECSSTASKKDHGYFGKEERDDELKEKNVKRYIMSTLVKKRWRGEPSRWWRSKT